MSRHRMFELIMVLISFSCMKSLFAQSPTVSFLKRSVRIDTVTYCYRVYVPAEHDAKKKWPVILFLHGAGERGSKCVRQTEVGIGPAIKNNPERFQCVVVMPQCRRGEVWAGDMEKQALAALEQTMKEFNGDPKREYLTGLSMGGYGVWQIAARHPTKFAAIAPVCGGVVPPPYFPFPPYAAAQIPKDKPYETIARRIGKTPVWIFHGDADRSIPVTESRQMFEALKAIGGNVKYSEYEGVEHNSWDRAYGEKEFLPWLLAQRVRK